MLSLIWLQLGVRGKNNKERLSGFFTRVSQSVDEVLLSNQKDKDDFFEGQKTFLVEYFNRIKDATGKSDRMTKSHKSMDYFMTLEIMLHLCISASLLVF